MPLNRTSNKDTECAEDYPECLSILAEKVRPERLKKSKDIAEYPWWQYWRHRDDLYRSIAGMEKVLFHPFTSKYITFVFVPATMVYGSPHVVMAIDGYAHFAALQSSFHQSWAFQYCSTHETRLRYAASDIFETFPLPTFTSLVFSTGNDFYEQRAAIMQSRVEGLTKLYNRFHDPNQAYADISKLRELQVAIDLAVAAAYGWQDLNLDHGFHDTKQGIRYTISEAARREVLDRLLALNHQRHAEEEAEKAALPVSASTKRGRKQKDTGGQITMDL